MNQALKTCLNDAHDELIGNAQAIGIKHLNERLHDYATDIDRLAETPAEATLALQRLCRIYLDATTVRGAA